jgi:dGTPase
VVTALFMAYADNPALLGAEWHRGLPADDTARARHIADYIAGMTDRFALDRFADIHGADAVPEALR